MNFNYWKDSALPERLPLLERGRGMLLECLSEMARLLIQEQGEPLVEAVRERLRPRVPRWNIMQGSPRYIKGENIPVKSKEVYQSW
ncbi:MAG: hypothetical protein DDT25_00055 [Chloroflexi bacterium]|nr:hypothetical protein [Chloroflexota bacterium]